MKKSIFLLLLCTQWLWAQDASELEKRANDCYRAKSYHEAGVLYKKSADHAWMNAARKKQYYNAACAFALSGEKDKAFENLGLMLKYGYSNREQLENDTDLQSLHDDIRWQNALSSIKKKVADSPHKSKYFTTDIDLFYRAFDLALKDPARAAEIFRNEYFAKGTDGLQDFFIGKINDEQKFAQTVLKLKDFYAQSRATLAQTNALRGPVRKYASKFEELYPQAVFPDVYFVVGRLSSNGTISDNGLLIGAEQMSKTPQTDTAHWNDWQREWVMDFGQIPVTVTHELVHFNQNGMKRENTLLCYALFEGSAEFIAELITGQTDGNYATFKGHEQRIWNDFETERRNDTYDDWIEAQPNRPRNALYWAGYMISKAYYTNASDKKKAIADILNIQDYESFFAQSGAADFIKALQ
ncbi:TPR end-of-group domain-containing protein [Flavobacterium caeni]|uniref:Predicted Zn-dependent protease n=1 Tax=Flavobacterium caeni TaxID=490189 RepID=A0A1G5ITP0_9FLAO|nr:hypothetical protein [Flavobacterium caeni]SCY79091.1 Predicted Zn-dependent protease [Flavobacterium caeni]